MSCGRPYAPRLDAKRDVVESSLLFVPAQLDRLRVVLVATRNPLNIGAVARAMSNFGALHLRVVNPYQVAFREARSAIGASALLRNAEEFECVADAVADCTLVVGTTAAGRRDLQHPLKRLELGARLIRRQLASGRVAFLFGSEKTGLSNADLSHCHWLMQIPTRPEHRSMNLGQAVAVCLYELVREARATRKAPKQEFACASELERITSLLFDVLRSSGYVKPRADAVTEEKVRRMVRRLGLPKGDAEIWLGMLRQIRWKIGSTERSN
jgi:TrmH family RNA methyltransferase